MRIPGNFMRGIVDRFKSWKKPKDTEAVPKGGEAPKDSYVADSGESRGTHASSGNEAVKGLSEPSSPKSALTSPTGDSELGDAALAPRNAADASLLESDESTIKGLSYKITQAPLDLGAQRVSFQVTVGTQSFDIKSSGPMTEADLKRIVHNVAKTAVRLSSVGIPNFQNAKFSSNGDVQVDKPIFRKEGPLAEKLINALDSQTIQGSVKGLSLNADGSVKGQGRRKAFPAESEITRPGGDLSNLAKDAAEDISKAAHREEETLVEGFLPQQLGHITDPNKRSAEEKKNLAYTRLDNVMRNQGDELREDKLSPVFKEFSSFLGEALGLPGASEGELYAGALKQAKTLVLEVPSVAEPYEDTIPSTPEEHRLRLEEGMARQRVSIRAKQAYMLLLAAERLNEQGRRDSLDSTLRGNGEPGFGSLQEFITQYEGDERNFLGPPAEDFWDKNWKMLQLREEWEALSPP